MEVSGQLHSLATLLSGGKSPQYPLDRSLGGHQSALDAVEKSAGNRTQAVQPFAIPTELSQLLNRREVFQNPFNCWYLYLI
jgi:hypothetical protein